MAGRKFIQRKTKTYISNGSASQGFSPTRRCFSKSTWYRMSLLPVLSANGFVASGFSVHGIYLFLWAFFHSYTREVCPYLMDVLFIDEERKVCQYGLCLYFSLSSIIFSLTNIIIDNAVGVCLGRMWWVFLPHSTETPCANHLPPVGIFGGHSLCLLCWLCDFSVDLAASCFLRQPWKQQSGSFQISEGVCFLPTLVDWD